MKNAVPRQESSLTPGTHKQKKQAKDTYICDVLNPQHTPIGIKFRMPKWGAIPTHNIQISRDSIHPVLMRGEWELD